MRVLYLQQQPCVRALKYAAGLRAARPCWRLGFAYQGKTLSEWYGSGDELFERWWDLGAEPERALPAVLDEFRPAVVHSHNLPDSLTVLAGELLDEIRRRYRVRGRTLVFASYALRRDLPPTLDATTRRNGLPSRLVYQGTLSTNGGHYDLRDIFRALVAAGATLDVYPSREAPPYRELAEELSGLRYHDTVEPSALLRMLPRYDFGWAGFNDGLNRAHLDTALPNKLFEYLGCGLPVLTLGHRALRRFVEERGLGVALPAPRDLEAELAGLDVAGLRERVEAARYDFTVEANIERVARLYEEVAG